LRPSDACESPLRGGDPPAAAGGLRFASGRGTVADRSAGQSRRAGSPNSRACSTPLQGLTWLRASNGQGQQRPSQLDSPRLWCVQLSRQHEGRCPHRRCRTRYPDTGRRPPRWPEARPALGVPRPARCSEAEIEPKGNTIEAVGDICLEIVFVDGHVRVEVLDAERSTDVLAELVFRPYARVEDLTRDVLK